MRIKDNKIDIVHLWNIILIWISLFNILLAFLNCYFENDIIYVVNYTIGAMELLFAIIEFFAIKHNEKVIKKLLKRGKSIL